MTDTTLLGVLVVGVVVAFACYAFMTWSLWRAHRVPRSKGVGRLRGRAVRAQLITRFGRWWRVECLRKAECVGGPFDGRAFYVPRFFSTSYGVSRYEYLPPSDFYHEANGLYSMRPYRAYGFGHGIGDSLCVGIYALRDSRYEWLPLRGANATRQQTQR